MTSTTHLPHIATKLLNQPLMVDPAKARVIADALASRIGLAPPAPTPAAMVDDGDGAGGYSITDGVAIIRVGGSLIRRGGWIEAASGVVSYETIAADVDRALADPGVAAILFDMDSPGGEVAGVFDLADKIHAARGRKPMWAASNEMALSAAYCIASACDVVAVTRTAYAGSIGVLAMHTDFSQAEANAGLKVTTIFAGDRKKDLSPHEPLSPEAAAALQEDVDTCYAMFCETVARNRRMTVDAVRGTQARVYVGGSAVRAGLADRVESFDATLAALKGAIGRTGTPGALGASTPRPAPRAAAAPPAPAAGPVDPAPAPAAPPTPPVDHRAVAAAIVSAAKDAGLPGMAAVLVKECDSLEQAQRRLETPRKILQAATDARTANPLISEALGLELATAPGMTLEAARLILDSARVAAQSSHETINAHAAGVNGAKGKDVESSRSAMNRMARAIHGDGAGVWR